MSNLQTLRDHMFSTLAGLKEGTIDIEKAKVMGEIGQVLINTAKVEVDFIRANNGGRSEFLENSGVTPRVTQTPTATGLKVVEGNLTRHVLK